ANPPLHVDADAELPGAVAFQGFKMVARQAAQIVHAGCRFQNFETLPALPVEALKGADNIAPRKRFRLFVPETQNHKSVCSNVRYTSSIHFSLSKPFSTQIFATRSLERSEPRAEVAAEPLL